MKPKVRILVFRVGAVLGLIAVCGLSCYLAVMWAVHRHGPDADPAGMEWLHERLGIDATQVAGLEDLELRYSEQRSRLMSEMEALQARLATQLRVKSEADAEVVETIEQIHGVHGGLQELSVRYYFDLLRLLPDEQQTRLRRLAAQSLSKPL